jgi:cobalt/nickel transport system ATP-binding protein
MDAMAMPAADDQQAVLQVEGLRLSYPDRPEVLCGVDLAIGEGEHVGIIGPNGAGKTTLFLAVCGVVAPSGGSIRLFGEPVRPGRFRSDIGLVFQNPDHQLFCPTVAEDLAFGPRNLGLPPEAVAARVAEAVAATGVGELEQFAPHHLSGGEKRMVSIAAVLAMQPRLMIYDEPTANLDIRSRRRLIRFLQSSSRTRLVASHDLELILEVCPRVVLLDEGRVVADGPAAAIMNDVRLMERHGLERPHSLVPHADPHHHH